MAIQTNSLTLLEKKQASIPITMLTAYDALTASIINQCDIDIVLVGDSLGNVFQGQDTTTVVTLSDIIYHTKAVKQACHHSFLVSDMPFLSAHISEEKTIYHAGELIQKGGAHAVKIEVSNAQLSHVSAVINAGIPVMGHIGFTPQRVGELGGYKVQGRSKEGAESLINLALALQDAGVFAIILEMIPHELAQTITNRLSIPTIGVGAGIHCDGQVLVTEDLLGLTPKAPKFVKRYASFHDDAIKAITAFKSDVITKQFPDNTHSFT